MTMSDDEEIAQVYFHVCTQEQVGKWKRLAETRPARVVAVLKLGPTERTSQGDTVQEVLPALIAVRTIAAGLEQATKSGGDLGRAAAQLRRVIKEGMADFYREYI